MKDHVCTMYVCIFYLILTLFSEFGLALLHRADEHITNCCAGQAVKTATNPINGDNKQILGACVIGTIDHLN